MKYSKKYFAQSWQYKKTGTAFFVSVWCNQISCTPVLNNPFSRLRRYWPGLLLCLSACTPPAPTPQPALVSTTPSPSPSLLPAASLPLIPASPLPSSLLSTPAVSATALPSPEPTVPSVPQPSPSVSATMPLSFSRIQPLIQKHCVACHGFSGGLSLESKPEILSAVERIRIRAIVEKSMPPSGMPEEARNLLASWLDSGAQP